MFQIDVPGKIRKTNLPLGPCWETQNPFW